MIIEKVLLLLTLSVSISVNVFSQKWIMFCAQDEKAVSEEKHALVNFFETKEADDKYVIETASFGYNPIIGLLSHVVADGTWMANSDFRKDRMCVVEVSDNEYNSCLNIAKKSSNKKLSIMDQSYISLVDEILTLLLRVKQPKANTSSVFDFLQAMKTLNKGVDEASYSSLTKATGKTPFYPLVHYLGYWEGKLVNPRTNKSEDMSFDISYPKNTERPVIILYRKENGKSKIDTLAGSMQGILLEVPFQSPATNDTKKICDGFLQIQSRGLNQIQASFAMYMTLLQERTLVCPDFNFIGNKKTKPTNLLDIKDETKEIKSVNVNFKINPKDVTLPTDKDFRWFKWEKAPEDLKNAARFIHTYKNRFTQEDETLFDQIKEFLDDKSEVRIAAVDLNNDGICGLAVFAEGSAWCGSAGCAFRLFDNGGLFTVGLQTTEGALPTVNGIKASTKRFFPLKTNSGITVDENETIKLFTYGAAPRINPPVCPNGGGSTPSELGRLLLQSLQRNNKTKWQSLIHPTVSEERITAFNNSFEEIRHALIDQGIENWSLVKFSRVTVVSGGRGDPGYSAEQDGEKMAYHLSVEFEYKEFIGVFKLGAAKTCNRKNYFMASEGFDNTILIRKNR